jgi:hypothetical protein
LNLVLSTQTKTEGKASAVATCKDIMYTIGDLLTKISLVEGNNNTIKRQRTNTLNRAIAGVTVLFAFVTCIVVGLCFVIYKSSKGDYWALATRILMMIIIYVVAIGLYGFALMYIIDQIQSIKVESDIEKTTVQAYKFFMYQSSGVVSDSVEFERVMMYAKKQVGISEANRKKLISSLKKMGLQKYSDEDLINMDKLVATQWKSMKIVIDNVYNKGSWIANLNNVESSTTTSKTFQGINNMLSPYYDLMLKSRQVPADAQGKTGVQKILDKFVIDEINQIDLFGLDETARRQQDNVIIQNMEGGKHYQVLLRGIYQFIIYFYPVYKNVQYAKFALLDAQSSTLSAAEKSRLNDILSQDPVLNQVLKAYPLKRERFTFELESLSTNSDDTYKTTMDDFIKLSVSTFTDIQDRSNERYMLEMNSTPSISDTKNLMIRYSKEFNAYFTTLVNNFITNEFATLNPRSTQYFIFKPDFMRSKLAALFQNTPLLPKMDTEYIDLITTIFVDTLMAEQKNIFIKNFYDFSRDSSDMRSLRLLAVEKKTNDVVAKIASNMVKFNISLAANSKYILDKVARNEDNLSSAVTSAVETIITNIDHQVNTLKAANAVSLYENNENMRFVETYDFIEAIDQKQFNTLLSSFRVAELKRLVNAMGDNNYLIFHDREYSVKQGKFIFGITTTFIALTFVYYGLNIYRKKVQKGALGMVNDAASIKSTLLTNEIISAIAKIGIPFAGAIMFLAIFRSSIVKTEVNIEFDKGRMKDNTEAIKDNITKLNNLMTELATRIPQTSLNKAIGDLDEITQSDKTRMYDLIKTMMVHYDKCNYIIGANNSTLPFPYAEVIADGTMAALIVGVIGYVLYEFAPLNRVVELKDLIEYRQAAQTLVSDASFIAQITALIKSHDMEVDNVMFTVRAIAIVGVIIFMLVYTSKIVGATKVYKSGLYNSAFMVNSQCCDTKR